MSSLTLWAFSVLNGRVKTKDKVPCRTERTGINALPHNGLVSILRSGSPSQAKTMNIIPDPTLILLQFIPFAVTITALYFIIFKPMLAYLDERGSATVGAQKEAKALEAQAVEKAAELEARIKEAQTEIGALRIQARNEALAEYNTLIEAARAQADAKIEAATAELEAETEATRTALTAAAKDIASQIATKATGRDFAVG